MNLTAALTAWRDARSVEDAIKHHDRAQLAVAASLALTFAVTLLKGTKYAAYASALDPDTLTAIGVLVAGAAASFGHWSARGAVASGVASSDGAAGRSPESQQGPLDSLAGGKQADAQPADPVRVGPTSDDPARNDLSGGA
jgi:hypothetical protein